MLSTHFQYFFLFDLLTCNRNLSAFMCTLNHNKFIPCFIVFICIFQGTTNNQLLCNNEMTVPLSCKRFSLVSMKIKSSIYLTYSNGLLCWTIYRSISYKKKLANSCEYKAQIGTHFFGSILYGLTGSKR